MVSRLVRNKIDFNKANELLTYDPETGVFIWKSRSSAPAQWNTRYAGTIAGTLSQYGYISIKIERQLFQAHRIAWLLMTGKMPEDCVDHIDGVRDNNAWSNLRAANHTENNSNRKMRSNNTSGIKGVAWYKRYGKWRSQITFKGRHTNLGYFDTIEEAAKAYSEAAINIHKEFANDGHGPMERLKNTY